jgi:hypothetical protein
MHRLLQLRHGMPRHGYHGLQSESLKLFTANTLLKIAQIRNQAALPKHKQEKLSTKYTEFRIFLGCNTQA